MRRDFFETLRLFCVLGALLIIGLVIFSALFAGCKPVNELQCSEAGNLVSTRFRVVTVDGHDYILAKDIGYCSIAIAHHAGCKKCAEERKRSVYEDMLCASTGNEGYLVWTNVASSCGVDGKPIPRAVREDIEKLKNDAVAEALRQRELVLDGFNGKER